MVDHPNVQRGCIPPDLRRLATRLIWWKPPELALEDPVRFLAQAMTLGTWEDLEVARRYWSDEDLRETLRKAPPGVFDRRSWNYWHLVLGMDQVAPLPRRMFEP